jgi:hypothetical protein
LPSRDNLFGEIDVEDLKPSVPDLRGREWPLWVERMAKLGLVEDDTMAEVVFELAKWLLWVELYDVGDRESKTVELLQSYILEKHNGFVTRLDEGKEGEVLSHVVRIVQGACDMPPESKELFLRIRQKRQQRRYKRVIEIVPILGGVDGHVAEGAMPGSAGEEEYNCTTYSLPLSDIPIPPTIEDKLLWYARTHRMRRSGGEYPIVRFARRFLGVLRHNRGSARIHTDDLTSMAGNVHQQDKYKEILRGLCLVRDWTGTYRKGFASSLYRLTDEARLAYEEAYRTQRQVTAV